jgi:prepilin-type N-terminal cleavage/methylation domain-containing protein
MGFTLIELLVVIAILALLLAVIVPALYRAQALTQRATCASNLHQIGLAAAGYAVTYHRRLPTHYGSDSPAFDTFWMRRDDGQFVNLGLLLNYASAPEVFYCPSQDENTSPSIGHDTKANHWGQNKNTASAPTAVLALGGPRLAGDEPSGKGPQPRPGVNASFPARARLKDTGKPPPRWTTLNYGNKVIYSDFIGVDNWPGQGRFKVRLQAPHNSEGCNRLFGDGSALWADMKQLHALRPVNQHAPSKQELHAYYDLLDVLP